MKGLRIIPVFAFFIIMTYGGMIFVHANSQEVKVQLGSLDVPQAPLGLVVLTSVLIGMLICGFLCSIELLAMYVQNKRLKRRLSSLIPKKPEVSATPQADVITPRTSGRFT